MSAYANVYLKTICEYIRQINIVGPRSIAGVPLSQAAPVYLIPAHHLCAFLLYLSANCVATFTKKKNILHTCDHLWKETLGLIRDNVKLA